MKTNQSLQLTDRDKGESVADTFRRIDDDGAFSGNPKYNAALSKLANTRLSDDELKAIYGRKWQQHKD